VLGVESFVQVRDLKVWFPVRRMSLKSLFGEARFLAAVDGVTLRIKHGEVLGLVGESGSGKTTFGRGTLRLVEPTGGQVIIGGIDVTALEKRELRKFRQKMQIIFQDPAEALSDRYTVARTVREPLTVNGIGTPGERRERAAHQLSRVGLEPHLFCRYPHNLSGGQRQRVAIARALVLEPWFLVADEPVSMLDVAIRSDILRLILQARSDYKLTILYITHDLATAHIVCDRIAVMYLGKLCEVGPTEVITSDPVHPYARALLEATPAPDPRAHRLQQVVGGEIPSALSPPAGCRFHPRCPEATSTCAEAEPELVLVEGSENHYVACHLYGEEGRS
jgi:peptide/nickel transport system ATP-binding protein